ncbi:MAG: phage tail tape measure protein [Burkholderiaceae bacterium]|nr:MAG: phage tail tape measure protein [Burkholderiaceae bacterium]
MSSNLNLALTLNLHDKLVAPLQRALNEVSHGVNAIQKDLLATQQAGDKSTQTLTNVAIKAERLGGVQGPMSLTRGLASAGNAAENAQIKTGRLAGMLEKLPGLAQRATTAFIGLSAAQRTISAPVKAFANLEEANTALKVTMMTKGGKISSNYGEIQKIAVDLGNKLPGSTRDFVTAANELLSLGVNEKAVVNGGLTAAAHLGVVLHMPQQQSAETVAKMREAYNLKDEELPGMADEIQRNRFAFGIQPSDLLLAAKYSAPTLNTLGLNGKNSMSEILTLQGMANLKGMDGSQFGTNFDMMLQRLAKGPLMLEQAKRGMKAEARDVMDKAGIKFDFYDSKGKLKTEDGSAVKGMLRELEKLELIRQKFGDKAAMEVAGGVFGQEAARPAQILAQYGVKGYEAARERVTNQATLEERTTESLTTLNAKVEAVSGSFENLQANMGKQLGDGAKPGLVRLNDFLGDATDFAEKHPAAGTATVLGAGAGAGWGAWKASGAIWSKLTGAGGAAAAGAAAESAAAGGGLMASLGRFGTPGALLALLASTFFTSDADMEVLRNAESMKKGYRGKGFDDPRRLDRADGGIPAILSRIEALSNRPVVLTVDGQVLAQTLDKHTAREARRN